MNIAGPDLVYAWKKAAPWGTAVACGVGDGLKAPAHGIKPSFEAMVDDCVGQAFATSVTPGALTCSGDISPYVRYNDIVLLKMLAQFFGTAGTPSLHAAGAISYDHTLKVAKNVDGKFGTLCALMGGVYVEEFPSVKVSKAVFKLATGQPMSVTLSLIANDMKTDSSTNTTSTMANVTFLEPDNRAYAGQAELRVNAASGGALSGSDKLCWSDIEITLERAMEGINCGTTTGGTTPRDVIDEPTANGLITGSIKITVPRVTGDTFGNVRNLTSQKAELILTGGLIEGAIPYLIKFQMPNLSPTVNDVPHAAGKLVNTREFNLLGAAAAPTGMTGNTDPLWLLLTNKISTDLLA